MKMHHFINSKNKSLFLLFFLCAVLMGGCASLPNKRGSDDFLNWYKEYQSYARAGQAAINKREYVRAIDHYTRAIELSPFESSHYYYRGLAWYKKGNKKRAIEDFDKVIILDSGWRSAYIYRGLCQMKGGEYKKALSDYTSALNLKHDDAGSLEPPGGAVDPVAGEPVSTMKTLDEIYKLVAPLPTGFVLWGDNTRFAVCDEGTPDNDSDGRNIGRNMDPSPISYDSDGRNMDPSPISWARPRFPRSYLLITVKFILTVKTLPSGQGQGSEALPSEQ